MNTLKIYGQVACRVVGAIWVLVLALPGGATATSDQKFDVLQIGTQSYTNVTVTTKAKNYVFLLHAAGMSNIKVADLSPDVREKLGYEDTTKPKVSTNGTSIWAKETIAKMETPQVKEVERQVEERWRAYFPGGKSALSPDDWKILGVVLGILFLCYLFFSFCCRLICLKAGQQPGILVWLPLFKLFPLLRAADMSYWWFLGYFVPVLNIVTPIVWCFKIAKARGKSAWVGFFLVLPITNLFAFLYLAFSDGNSEEEAPRKLQVMSLETA